MKKFIYRGSDIKLTKHLAVVMPELSYRYLMELLRLKDVKINGKRVSKDTILKSGDSIEVYAREDKLIKFTPKIVFEDTKVLITHKPRSISSEDYQDAINKYYESEYVLAHRLDTNTEGLLIFAKDVGTFDALVIGFKAGAVIKRYLAEVNGSLNKEGILKAYLKKDSDTATVAVFNKQVDGSEEIITEVKPILHLNNSTIVEVRLHTGKTHQIRAHLAHIKYPIVGDPKYGDYKANRSHSAKRQRLSAYKLNFNFIKSSPLFYLNEISLETSADFYKI
ncbi:MAG: RluA family pseudouridine synthase [Bacillota bacterium]